MLVWLFALAVTAPAPVTYPVPATAAAGLAEIERALAADQASLPPAPPPVPVVTPGSGTAFNPALSFIGTFTGAYFEGTPAQTGEGEPGGNGVYLQELELGVRSNVDPYFSFQGYLGFGLEGVEAEEVYVTTLDLPANLQLRAGKFRARFGRMNPMHPHMWRFVDQPLALGRMFGGAGLNGVGLEPSVLLPLPWYAEVIAAALQPGGEPAAAFGLDEEPPIDRFDKFMYQGALKQYWDLSDDLGLSVGLSAMQGPGPRTGDRTYLGGADMYLKYRPLGGGPDDFALMLQGEWFERKRDWFHETVHDGAGYVELAAAFTRRWSAALRAERVTPGSLTLAVMPGDRDVVGVTNEMEMPWLDQRLREALEITFAPTEFSRIRLQQNRDRIPAEEKPVWGTFVKLEVSVGAHGAHAY